MDRIATSVLSLGENVDALERLVLAKDRKTEIEALYLPAGETPGFFSRLIGNDFVQSGPHVLAASRFPPSLPHNTSESVASTHQY